MKLPEQINIMGYMFDVEWVSDKDMRNFIGRDEKMLGAVNTTQQRILMNEESVWRGDRKLEVLMHEVIHAVSDMMGLDFDERTVERLGFGLTPTIKQLIQGGAEEK